MGSSPASSYRPLVRPAELADRDALVSLAETALAQLDNQRGGDVFRHRDARPSPAGPTIDAELAAAMTGDVIVLVGCLGAVPVGYAVATVDVDEQAIADAIVAEIQDQNLVQVVVQPLVANVQRTDGSGGVISGWTYARLVASWNVKDVDLSGHDLRLILYNRNDPASAIVEYSTRAGEITITYNNPDSLVEVDGPDSKTPNAGNYAYVLRDQSTDAVLLAGICKIYDAPDAS